MLLRRRPESGLLGGMIEVPSSDWLERAAPGLDAVRAQAPVEGGVADAAGAGPPYLHPLSP